METYHGHVRTPADAIILFEACRIGLLPRVQRRLSEKERQSIKSGSVFVWDEREAGMRRWTDGKSWSASRVAGSFLTYREMEGKRGGGFDKTQNRESVQNNDPDSDGGPDGYRYKVDGLIKQSFSITTNNGQHLHLISYFSRSSSTSQNLTQPTNDPQLRHIRPEKGMYPESTVHEQSNIPAVTRGPMSSPGYSQPPHHPPYTSAPSYPYPQHPQWAPPSPMHTPPPNYAPYAYHHHHPPPHHPAYPHTAPVQHMQYPPHPHYPGPHLQSTAFDRPPPHLQSSALPPPPPPPGYAAYPPGHYPPPPYQNGYGPYPPPGYAHSSHQYPPPSQHAPQPYHNGPPSHYTPAPDAQGQGKRDSPQPSRPTSFVSTSAPGQGIKNEERERRERSNSDSQPATSAPLPLAPATSPPSSGQTIPSISAMLNGRDGGAPPIRSSSRSPNNGSSAIKGPSDIPSHKLGFEANRDMEALRNLDKTTFKGY